MHFPVSANFDYLLWTRGFASKYFRTELGTIETCNPFSVAGAWLNVNC